ncbi:MAG: hypothetical protein ACRDMV_08985 [Streptosporangiales bacterium]
MTVFTAEERQRLQDELVSVARADPRISGAALTGSAALDREDRWSDIDLALCVSTEAGQAIDDWTSRMYGEHGAVDHLDVPRGETLFRVFLLRDTLQVDLSFWPRDTFGPIGPSFRLLFGTAARPTPAPDPGAAELIGAGWLYALHARSSIERGRVWQAEYMISGVRDHVLALACARYGLPTVQGRGMSGLPPEATAVAARALVASADIVELRRAFVAATEALLEETRRVDPERADRLAGPLGDLAS